MRCRCSFGRMSPTVWVAALVWPLAWQSKQATPWCALTLRRSSVRLNCCCGNGVSEQPQAFELLRVEDLLEQPLEVVERDQLALGDVAEVGPGHQEDRRRQLRDAGDRAGRSRDRSGSGRARSASSSRRSAASGRSCRRSRDADAAAGRSLPARRSGLLISSGVIAASFSHVMPAGSFTRTPSCTALPRDIVTPGAGRFARS